MKQTVTKSAFVDAFRTMGRFDQFGAEALGMLFDYFKDLDPETELDVIAICCEFAVSTLGEVSFAYDIPVADVVEFLQENTRVIGECSDGRLVYCSEF